MTKVLNLLSKYLPATLWLGLGLSAGLTYLAHFYYTSHQDPEVVEKYPLLAEIERLHNQTIDLRLRQRGPRSGSDQVAILTIDEKAIQKYGRWPWPRSMIASVIDDILNHGAKSISFDIIFSESQDNHINSLENIETHLKQALPQQSPLVHQVIANEKARQNHDQKLSQTIEKYAESLIMGAVYDEFTFRPFPFQDACFLNIAKTNGTYDYWDKEAYLIGVQNPLELQLPEAWDQILLTHFEALKQNVVYEWLKISDHPITSYLKSKDHALEKKNTVALVTAFVQNKQELFHERNQGPNQLDWSSLNRHLPKNQRVELVESMNQVLDNYCLRYLTNKDELAPTFVAQWDDISKGHKQFAKMSFEEAKEFIMATQLNNLAHHVDRWLFNIPELQDVTEHSGTFNATQDKDGSVRRAKLFVRNGNLFIPSLAFKTYLVINNYYPTANILPNPYEDPPESSIVTYVQLKNSDGEDVLTIPTDHRGQLPINYAGPQKMFSYLSASEILDGKDELTIEQRRPDSNGNWVEEKIKVNKKEYLKGKSFIFGATATGIYDLRVTPFEENYPGVETHANMLDNLIRQDYLKTSNKEEWVMPLSLFVLGLFFTILISYFGAISGLAITLASLATIYLVDFFFMFSQGLVVVILFPLATILFLYTALTFFKYFTEEKKKQQLKGTFQKYVSPEIVNEILKDPSKLELGGIKQEMSVFFSDIRGFTTISEKLDPKALSDLLNHYLTPMTAIVFSNKGTLDKYMGDAIMAFFGAPVPSDQHAAQACRAAIQQIDKLFELQKIYEKQGLPMIDIGIGINTGDMSVGNMGSETVRNYTVMGDAVNLGARLEGINKQYGTRIIISEFTKEQISPEEFIYREIDWVKVKGKNEPVRIYELIGMGTPSEEKRLHLKHFNSGFQLYHQKQWQSAIDEFNQALNYDASDYTGQLYIKRCQDYMTQPPGPTWDGVFTMTTK